MAAPKAISGNTAKPKTSAPPAVSGKTPTKSTSTKSTSSTNKVIAAGLGEVSKGLTGVLTLIMQAFGGEGGSAGSGPYAGYSPDSAFAGTDRSGTSSTGKHYINGKLASDAEWTTFLNPNSGSGGGGSSTTTTNQEMSAADRDAFALLKDTFTMYGLGDLAGTIENYMKQNMGPEEAKVLLKQTDVYKKRFIGNETRRAAGLNVLTEAEYVATENKYSEILTAYGQKSLASRDEFGVLIGGDISAAELQTRLGLAVDSVKNADPNIMRALKSYYPGVTDNDLVGYFLAPDKKLPELQQKVTTAQISAAAAQFGLTEPTLAGATELAQLGVDQAAARTGFQKVAQVLPQAQKIGDIYKEAQVGYDQGVAQEEFLKGNASAQRKRRQLQQLEEAAFSGRSGVESQYNPLAKSIQGSF